MNTNQQIKRFRNPNGALDYAHVMGLMGYSHSVYPSQVADLWEVCYWR